MHPNPGDPKLEAIAATKRKIAEVCLKGFISKNARPDGDAPGFAGYKLIHQACKACDKEITASGIAEYDDSHVRMPLTANIENSVKNAKMLCPVSYSSIAVDAILDLEFNLKKMQKDALKIQYAGKIAPAMACSTQAAKIYALTTPDSAESVATASFEKCHDLWSEAAEFALKLFPNLSEFDRWDALKKNWLDHGISAVVDQRARQKLGQPPPPDATVPNTKQSGTGI